MDLKKVGIATVSGSKPPDRFAKEQMPQFLTPHEALRWLLSSPKVLAVSFVNHQLHPGDTAVECRAEIVAQDFSQTSGAASCSQVAETPEEAAYLVFRWLERQRVL